jgi:pimeloyl-ACP methyl ester carboxylesterase
MKKQTGVWLLAGVVPTLAIFASAFAAAQSAPFYPGKALSQEALTRPLAIAKQGSFFVGGRELKSDVLSTQPAYDREGTITVDQMYVHFQVPVSARELSLVLIHGCCLTGKTWETTPDGRMGWDEYFVRRGYPTYVIDQAGRGRSAVDASAVNAAALKNAPATQMPNIFAAGHEGAWKIFRFGPQYPETYPGLRFPVSAANGLWAQMVADWNFALPKPNPTLADLSQLAKQLRKTVLISHSQSGVFPFQAADISTEGIAAIVALEPGACPAADGNLAPYKNIPSLVVFGDYVELSPRWAPRLKACREFVDALNKAGGHVELLVLPEIGIKGNSHMLMQDNNSIELADIVATWIETRAAGK